MESEAKAQILKETSKKLVCKEMETRRQYK